MVSFASTFIWEFRVDMVHDMKKVILIIFITIKY